MKIFSIENIKTIIILNEKSIENIKKICVLFFN